MAPDATPDARAVVIVERRSEIRLQVALLTHDFILVLASVLRDHPCCAIRRSWNYRQQHPNFCPQLHRFTLVVQRRPRCERPPIPAAAYSARSVDVDMVQLHTHEMELVLAEVANVRGHARAKNALPLTMAIALTAPLTAVGVQLGACGAQQ